MLRKMGRGMKKGTRSLKGLLKGLGVFEIKALFKLKRAVTGTHQGTRPIKIKRTGTTNIEGFVKRTGQS